MTDYINGLLGAWQEAVAKLEVDTDIPSSMVAILDAGDALASTLSASLSDPELDRLRLANQRLRGAIGQVLAGTNHDKLTATLRAALEESEKR